MTDSTNSMVNKDPASVEIAEELNEFRHNYDASPKTSTTAAIPSEQQLHWPDLFVATVALIAWFILFCGGILIATKPFRDQIGGVAPLTLAEHVKAWYVVVAFWTVSNIGLLACVAALLGAVGRRVGFTAVEIQEEVVVREVVQKQVGLYYSCAIMRGFGVYSMILAGIFVVSNDAVSFEQADYMKIASLMSIVGFYAGYDPVLFSGLLSRARKFMNALPI